jgi:hypothetical protein
LGFVEVNRLDTVSDECNRAVHLAVSIVLFREKLSAFIATLPANSRGSVETEIVRFVDVAMAFLEDFGRLVMESDASTKAFAIELSNHLAREFPWADKQSLANGVNCAVYHAWHEGY